MTNHANFTTTRSAISNFDSMISRIQVTALAKPTDLTGMEFIARLLMPNSSYV